MLLLLLPLQGKSQISETDLIGSWLPIGYKSESDSHYYNQPSVIFIFNEDGKGLRKATNNVIPNSAFSFKFGLDSVLWEIDNQRFQTSLPYFDGKILCFTDNSKMIIGFIPFPKAENKITLDEARSALENQSWGLVSKYADDYDLLYQFDDHLINTTVAIPESWSRSSSVRVFNDRLRRDDYYPTIWTLTEHDDTILLSIPNTSRMYRNYRIVIDKLQPDLIQSTLYTSTNETKLEFKKIPEFNAKMGKKRMKWLTSSEWRYDEKYIPPIDPLDTAELMDLGIVEDDFEELHPFLPEGYRSDSTLLISEEDLTNRQLILNFTKDGKYKILREDRQLDAGTWHYLFNETVIELVSERDQEMSDGVFGGTLAIKFLEERKLVVTRYFNIFENQLPGKNNYAAKDEVYLRIKKRK